MVYCTYRKKKESNLWKINILIIYSENAYKDYKVYYCQCDSLAIAIIKFLDYIGGLNTTTQALFKKAISNLTYTETIQFYNSITSFSCEIIGVLTDFDIIYGNITRDDT